MRFYLPALLITALAAPLAAQTGSYTSFGKGCPGSLGSCPSSNASGGQLYLGQNLNLWTFPADAQSPMIVTGFELYTRSRTSSALTIQTQVYGADAAGRPTGKPLRTGTMTIGTTAAFFTTKFAPLLVKPKQRIFIAYTSNTGMMYPLLRTGTKSTHYYRRPNTTQWLGPFLAFPWSWTLICERQTPKLSNSGVPTINKSFSVDLSGAKPTTAAVLILGGSNKLWGNVGLPLDLKPLQAPGCSLLVSFDATFVTAVDANGAGKVSFGIPNSSNLVGLTWHNQYFVIDKAANPLGASFSNGGSAKVGR